MFLQLSYNSGDQFPERTEDAEDDEIVENEEGVEFMRDMSLARGFLEITIQNELYSRKLEGRSS